MYYVKIPLRNLCKASELHVPEDRKQEIWDRRVKSLLEDLAEGVIPHWAIDFADLKNLPLYEDER